MNRIVIFIACFSTLVFAQTSGPLAPDNVVFSEPAIASDSSSAEEVTPPELPQGVAELDSEEDERLILTSLEDSTPENDAVPYDALRRFVDVFDSIKRNYIEEASNEVLIENAIRGMIGRLDPHSVYFNEEEYQAFKEQTDGEYAGIGVVLDFQNGAIEVISAIPGSPAERAGLLSGDIISSINQQSVQDITLQEAITMLEGQPETEIALGVLRGDEVINMNLTREIIQTNSVTANWLAPGVVQLRISQFQEDTTDSLRDTITQLQEKETLKGIILDLRNNPGGYLLSAVSSADLFLNDGDILSVRDREKMEQQRYSAEEGDILDNAPIVVMVNRGSASSAEILAAALQENRRGLVVGQKTFGKGSVQTLIPLYDGGAIKLTTAKYYTPKNNLIQARGITPDIQLTSIEANIVKESNVTSEANLPNHLKNEQQINRKNTVDKNIASLATSDFMLYEALNILNTMIISR
ncbi:S41 family peptidase [Cardiobacteriaceae bacterium TAE3-ERU3]|nr:S41 family peptidase [Cardiobacteriaceae bacterium TAE3-ERU3]